MNPLRLAQALQETAEKLGFVLFGITDLEQPPYYNAYAQWVMDGQHATMGYLATEKALEYRSNPTLVSPEARSVISVGLPYSNPDLFHGGDPSEPIGRIAAYAWGNDYHAVIPERLKKLGEEAVHISGKPATYKAYTDTGPILEHDFAQKAGLGWAGKNTCLINPWRGSYYLLGEMFLSLELPASEPFVGDRCGSCRRCIEACPTKCIREDRTLNAAHCISYLTIENKGSIPMELRESIGEWVFGCDVCQQVCPWNRFAVGPADPELSPKPAIPQPKLRTEIELSPQSFNQKFKASPIQRARRRGYLRNVAVALGNQPNPENLIPLSRILEIENEPLIRGHAAWAVGRIKNRKSKEILEKFLKSELDPGVRTEIHYALG